MGKVYLFIRSLNLVRIINAHVHIGKSLALSMDVKIEDVEKEMIEAGVHECLVFPFPSWAVENSEVNSWILEICERNKVFHPVFYVRDDLKAPENSRYVAVKWHWVRGVSDTKSNYSVLRDEGLEELVEEIIRLGVPVIFEEEFEFTKMFTEMFRDAKLIIPHLGALGGDPSAFLDEFENNENIYFDTSLSSLPTLLRFVERIGAKRMIFGSDLPFGNMKYELEKIINLEIDRKEKERILCRNIRKLCNI